MKGTYVSDSDEPIKVFTDRPDAMSSLKDARFQIVEDPEAAQIFWLIGANRASYRPKAIEKNAYLNEIPSDEALLVNDLFVPLMHSTFNCFSQACQDLESPLPETFWASKHLPAFIGRFYERED